MISDTVLLGVTILLIGMIAYLYHRSIQEDFLLWYGKWKHFRFWERAHNRFEEKKDK